MQRKLMSSVCWSMSCGAGCVQELWSRQRRVHFSRRVRCNRRQFPIHRLIRRTRRRSV